MLFKLFTRFRENLRFSNFDHTRMVQLSENYKTILDEENFPLELKCPSGKKQTLLTA